MPAIVVTMMRMMRATCGRTFSSIDRNLPMGIFLSGGRTA